MARINCYAMFVSSFDKQILKGYKDKAQLTN